MTNTTEQTIEAHARCKAFSGQGVREHKILIEAASDGGRVLVWDSVAHHYTRCHTLSAAAERRIIRAWVGV